MRVVALGRFLGWQIGLMGSELDKETFETGKQNSTADTWSESNRDKSLSSFQECQLNSLPASTSNALSSPYEKNKMP